ncbi:MAG: hypothetical protein GY906_23170 [bacterium]|nr:hypothetical protein [bacterium]
MANEEHATEQPEPNAPRISQADLSAAWDLVENPLPMTRQTDYFRALRRAVLLERDYWRQQMGGG